MDAMQRHAKLTQQECGGGVGFLTVLAWTLWLLRVPVEVLG